MPNKKNTVMTQQQYDAIAAKVRERMQAKQEGAITESYDPNGRDHTRMVGYQNIELFMTHMINGIRV